MNLEQKRDEFFSSDSDNDNVMRLAALSPLEYERCREDEAKKLNVRVIALDKQVYAAKKGKNSSGIDMDDIEPWHEPIKPDELLSDIVECINRFIICEYETAVAAALWVAMTHLMDVVQIAPLAVITAPEKRCGKSQFLFLLGRLVPRPLTASNISPAALSEIVNVVVDSTVKTYATFLAWISIFLASPSLVLSGLR